MAYTNSTPAYSSSYDRLPVGVGLLAVIMGVLGFLALLAGLLIFLSSWIGIGPLSAFVAFVHDYVITVGTLGGVLLFLAGTLTLGVAAGLWHQESWALWVCVGGIAILEAINFFLLTPFSYVFLGLLVLYIYLLAVRQHFR